MCRGRLACRPMLSCGAPRQERGFNFDGAGPIRLRDESILLSRGWGGWCVDTAACLSPTTNHQGLRR